MAQNYVQRFLENRYTYLLISLVLLIVVAPLGEEVSAIPFPILPLLFLGIMICVLRTLNLKKSLFYLCAWIAGFVFILDLGASTTILKTSYPLGIVASLLYSIFALISIVVIAFAVFEEKKVSVKTIAGGISVYLLLGILWAMLYQFLMFLNPASLSGNLTQFSDYLYFSFVTVTTLGYGDITPLTDFAKTLSIFEAVTGQLFITIFIARLVGLHLGQKN